MTKGISAGKLFSMAPHLKKMPLLGVHYSLKDMWVVLIVESVDNNYNIDVLPQMFFPDTDTWSWRYIIV